MRLLTGKQRNTPTVELLESTKSLSVQQLVASQTLVMVHKIVQNSKPAYLARRLKRRDLEGGRRLPGRMSGMLAVPRQSLSTTRAGFIARGSQLFNNLPVNLRLENNLSKFKIGTRKWITENIPARPT